MAKQPKTIADIYPLVVVIWEDHTGENQTWINKHKLEDHTGLTIMSTVGWLVKETESAHIVASTISDDAETFGDVNTIGKGLVHQVKVLRGKMKK